MSKRRLFNANDSNLNLSLMVPEKMTPNRGGIHPALISTTSSVIINATSASGAKKSIKRMSNVQSPDKAKKSKPDSGSHAEDSDSDPMEVPGFFSASVQKLPYTKEEDEMILKYVLKGQNIFKVGSILLWKHLEARKDNPRRTYHSLKNRFLRNIKPCLFTTFGHLTKDKTITERILYKFPELKHSLGRREILSNIRLPERRPPPKPTEEDGVSSTSTNEFRGNEDRVSPVGSPEPDNVLISIPHSREAQPEPNNAKAINSDSVRSVIYERTVKTDGNNITVCVDLKSKKYVETPRLGIYEMFEKLKRKNRFGFCPTCGRYSTPKRGRALKYNKDASIIPNSVETPESTSKSSKKVVFGSKFKNNTTPKQRKTNSEASDRSPCSPSLLSDPGEARDINKGTPERTGGENSNMAACSLRKSAVGGKAPQKSSSVGPGEKTGSAESRNEMLRMATANLRSGKEANSGSAKRRRDSDEDIESICEDAMANFRKLIDFEEEQQLVRKCLNRNFKSIGLEEVSQANWDSYFLESSSELDTPPLTIDFEGDTQNNERRTQSGSTSSSTLSKNTKKSVGKKKNS